MTGFGLTSPEPSEILAARVALNDGLQALRASMRGIMAESGGSWYRRALRGDGWVPRTRQRPHPNEAPPRQSTGDNTRQLPGQQPGRTGVSRPGGTLEPDTVPIPIRDTIPTQGGPTNEGPRAAPPTPPARPDPSDAASEVWGLIERAQGGDAAAFGLLYDRYFDTVFRFVYFRVGNRQLAEDLTADTFLRALKRISSFTWQGRDLGAWLVTIARNLVADHFKSGRYRLEVTTGDVLDADRPDRGPEGSPEAAVIDHVTNVDLLRAVKQLNPEQQECIVLRFLHGFSVAETAQAMNKNEGAIKALQYRAVRALARLLPDGFQP